MNVHMASLNIIFHRASEYDHLLTMATHTHTHKIKTFTKQSVTIYKLWVGLYMGLWVGLLYYVYLHVSELKIKTY